MCLKLSNSSENAKNFPLFFYFDNFPKFNIFKTWKFPESYLRGNEVKQNEGTAIKLAFQFNFL